ncbi:hypothetical protein HETIRDRAFT_421624 [Heterobasidion irregulare TC 32-1]|uniref:Uncharacterized protein n=1 Tax=Heterobasidion irregulare (strain TC 32-1) TaxID=747525 RepID=W4JWN0_HETIT|nr:uncharacterized protein HETIRDRAFT_421624 [Heterobasidion irregulare TC 32-1]ETW77500.1 hypothetical protein HETIRDRAFT_421624 [Heterobasidion irregulare TC 32-1]
MATPKQGPFTGPPPRYINDFSKALASEVRILLQEVGKLRDERRALQHEIAELMAVKSKHGAGGEYSPDWRPKMPLPDMLPPPEAPPALPPIEDIAPAKPGWRTVHKRPERPPRGAKGKQPAAIAPAPPPPPPEPPKPEMPSWAQWRRPVTPPPS